jgi:hypothetical protein
MNLLMSMSKQKGLAHKILMSKKKRSSRYTSIDWLEGDLN